MLDTRQQIPNTRYHEYQILDTRDTRCKIPNTRYQEAGTKQGTGTRNQKLGTRNQEKGTRNQEPGTKNQEPRTWNQELKTWNQESGTRNQEPGTRNQEPGKLRTMRLRTVLLPAFQENLETLLPSPQSYSIPQHQIAGRRHNQTSRLQHIQIIFLVTTYLDNIPCNNISR